MIREFGHGHRVEKVRREPGTGVAPVAPPHETGPGETPAPEGPGASLVAVSTPRTVGPVNAVRLRVVAVGLPHAGLGQDVVGLSP